MKNKRLIALSGAALCLALVLGTSAQQNGLAWRALKPDKGPSAVPVMVTGKKLRYYPLEKGKEIIVSVQGPTTLKVLSRIEFGENFSGEKRYYIRYERDGTKKGKIRRSAAATAGAVLFEQQKTHLGNSRSFFLKVPEGKHTYKFFVGSKAAYKVYLRFYEHGSPTGSESSYIAFAPSRFGRAVNLVTREEETTYYRSSQADTLRLSVIGPTNVQVLARLEFDPTMVTQQKFRVRVLENGLEKGVFALRSKPSEVTEYREKSDKLVGVAAKFFVEVPRGKHEYSFVIMDGGRGALLRFFIPRKDLANNL